MKLRPVIVIMLLASLGLMSITIQFARLQSMQRHYEVAKTRLLQTRLEAREMLELASRRPEVATTRKPTEDVLAQVNETLRDAGLDATTLHALTPQSDRPAPGSGQTNFYRVQSLRLNLTNLTLTQFGAFLHHWRQRDNLWIPARIEMNIAKERRRGLTVPIASYDITLHLEARYLNDTPASKSTDRPGVSS